MTTVLAILVAVGAAAAAWFFSTRRLTQAVQRRIAAHEAALEGEAQSIRLAAASEASATRKRLELDARESVQEARRRVDSEVRAAASDLAERELEVERREQGLLGASVALDEKLGGLEAHEGAIQEQSAAAQALAQEAADAEREREAVLERLAGESGLDIRHRLVAEWIEAAKSSAAERLRRIDAGNNDPAHGRSAKRVMAIAMQRYEGHYLTERMLTNIPITAESLPRILGESNANLLAMEEVSHVKLTPAETGESIRLEGQDSFGREIARRAIARFAKAGSKPGEALRTCQAIAEELEREVFELGKRAFKELEIPRAHPDIVKLVGKLNYRTSYTQNQWKHAIEASFICGMMAAELGLDVKLARRAALMHDIGKALTHEIDGSHAVIGADLARKLGESELVANAIGAHHTDEPFNSVYAYLVAAGDAMSGGRPGARRQQDDNYAERLEDLQRIAGNFGGVERVYPVFGGREVRVHVQENRISDERAVELSSEIAQRISDELTFPGQIKVTVIREVRAVEIAG